MLLTLITLLSLICAVGITCAADGFSGAVWLWCLPLSFAGAWVVLLLLTLLVLVLICAGIDREKPQEHDDPAFRRVTALYSELVVQLTMHLRITGREKLPKSGRFLLVCNHLSDLDPVVLMHAFPRSQLAFISKRENTDLPVIGKMMHRLMCQLLNRENNREALKTILTCVRLIQEDEVSIAVFPEGYTSKDGKLHHFRSGVFKIAMKTKVPIVVCTIQGTNTVLPPFAKEVRLGRPVELHLLEVIPPEAYEGLTTVELSDLVFHKMLADLGDAFTPTEQNP